MSGYSTLGHSCQSTTGTGSSLCWLFPHKISQINVTAMNRYSCIILYSSCFIQASDSSIDLFILPSELKLYYNYTSKQRNNTIGGVLIRAK